MVSLLRRVHRRLRFRPLHKPELSVDYTILGTDYGGWPVVAELLPAMPLVYSFGIGEDVSFDLAIIERFGARVHAFDPTSRSQEWIAEQDLPQAFNFHPIGIGSQDGEAAFFPPANDSHVSFSNAPAKDQSREPVYAQVNRLETIMRDLGHDDVDLLKMDIEGFEYAVIEDILASSARPTHILVEFHHGMYDAGDDDTRRAVEALHDHGYALFHVSLTGREYGFVRADEARKQS